MLGQEHRNRFLGAWNRDVAPNKRSLCSIRGRTFYGSQVRYLAAITDLQQILSCVTLVNVGSVGPDRLHRTQVMQEAMTGLPRECVSFVGSVPPQDVPLPNQRYIARASVDERLGVREAAGVMSRGQ